MKIITEELKNRFALLGRQDDEVDPIVVARYFNAFGNGTWLATEYDPISETCFGYVQLFENEWGYFSIKELSEVKHPQFGIPMIEIDLHFIEQPISQVCPELQKSIERQKQLREIEFENDLSGDFEPER